MEQTYQAYETLPGTHVMIGGAYGTRGAENPESRMILNLKVVPCRSGGGDPTGPEMDISVGITIQQAAWIVQEFFGDLTCHPRENIWKTFLKRMMRKRWATMTTPVAKFPMEGSNWFEAMKYPEIP
ncbi:hypothetical protein A3H65_01095 [Candidatus Giovannonibacteria bacterium RIFCSPLOWO2_02_FULL_45_14]|uniref:Uncharacterized protein n=1 Tax=Candidatus Giovannonibacteria bacterium RIFCSPLOWO2_12_FULL_44_15 TaxID=1798364 RepID=A0A1F5XZV8_9BACT|nr:MAG: hypothetical protein A3C75_01520 [Candidatus Giovannonibacteria bacterium RIFCSPHIGHO2_02_FULL_44_31]OGF76382.1 MAG: hypothetical protein A3E62_00565 [Candidatus Giovannonibacteria bacterium RIFCSPHIGHO2_12_FULL_44_29]OGF90936.1 MAG: hypothetical protein A3H65_01095 [Candidatus Giovannonibacteria bacterium RIFCSPLOWO2_02_FULL_45_14]OGF93455.1 MAG: hypothetical protein A3G54_04165 [Candidatus Giovannonibacteria bacterium RIFCSPLOWO2_12_FULL_44_15]